MQKRPISKKSKIAEVFRVLGPLVFLRTCADVYYLDIGLFWPKDMCKFKVSFGRYRFVGEAEGFVFIEMCCTNLRVFAVVRVASLLCCGWIR